VGKNLVSSFIFFERKRLNRLSLMTNMSWWFRQSVAS